jgi:ABC-2 type transport system permease protein
MKPRRLWAMTCKECLHIRRDPRSLGIAIALPLLLLVLYGYALTFDVDHVPMVVWDQSASPTSREFISRFTGSRYFSLRLLVQTYAAVERTIDTGQALVALVIPSDFARRVESGQSAQVQLIVDGSDANTATIAMGYAEVVTQTYAQDVAMQVLRQSGGQVLPPPVELRPRVWFNADMKSKNAIVPGLIAVIMMVIAALLTSLTVAREWDRGTMEQLLSTPVQGPELILGKLLPYFVLGMFDVVLAVIMGKFLFHVPLRGNVALLFGMTAIFLSGALSLGLVISIMTRSQLLASQLAMILTFLPAYLLSGFITPIHHMPEVLQWLTYVVPARYFVTLLRAIYLKGVGLEILAVEAGLLTLFGALMVILAHVKFTKKLV